MKVAIVGAGMAGSSLAFLLSRVGIKVTLFDENPNGMCHDHLYSDGRYHQAYGPHIFHYPTKWVSESSPIRDMFIDILKLTEWTPFEQRVGAITDHGMFSYPLNREQLKKFDSSNLSQYSPSSLLGAIELGFGTSIAQTFVKTYTNRQWGVGNFHVSPDFLSRFKVNELPFQNFFGSDQVSLIPTSGFSEWMKSMRSSSTIIYKNVDIDSPELEEFDKVIVTCDPVSFLKIPEYDLPYIHTEFKVLSALALNESDHRVAQAVHVDRNCHIYNNCTSDQSKLRMTRISCYNRFPVASTTVDDHWCEVVSNEPTRLSIKTHPNRQHHQSAQMWSTLVDRELKPLESKGRFKFHGRLGTYRYLDMNQIIKESIELFAQLGTEFHDYICKYS